MKFHRGSPWLSILSWLNLKAHKDYCSYEYYSHVVNNIFNLLLHTHLHTHILSLSTQYSVHKNVRKRSWRMFQKSQIEGVGAHGWNQNIHIIKYTKPLCFSVCFDVYFSEISGLGCRSKWLKSQELTHDISRTYTLKESNLYQTPKPML